MGYISPAGANQMVCVCVFWVVNIIEFSAVLLSYIPRVVSILNYHDNRRSIYISDRDLNCWIVIIHYSTDFINRLRWGYTQLMLCWRLLRADWTSNIPTWLYHEVRWYFVYKPKTHFNRTFLMVFVGNTSTRNDCPFGDLWRSAPILERLATVFTISNYIENMYRVSIEF